MPTPSAPEWVLTDVHFRHHGATQPTLRDITLAIDRGLLTVIIGPNGAGKSTLMQLLLGVERQGQGHVRFRGQEMHAWPRQQLAREIGVVPQGEVEPLFTVRDTVAMGRYAHLGAWQRERAEDVRAIDRAMVQCDVQQFASRWVPTLSGGERQRVRVARALAQETRVIVLDEPTTYLDIRHEMAMFEQVRRLRDDGVTVVLVTHNLNLAARYADRMVLLRDGAIVASGTAAEVLTAERVADVYEWPVDIEWHRDGAPQVVPQGQSTVPGGVS
jgi:iron complex transport system ATP-binding protein